MIQELLARSLSWPLRRITLLLLICWPNGADAQSPTSIGGRTFRLTIESGSGDFESSGSFRFLPSAVEDSDYAIVPIPPGSISPSIGTHTYTKTGANTGSLSLSDALFGPLTANCTFSSPTSGNYILTGSFLTGSQSGTFIMFSGPSPAAIAGSVITVTITSGDGVVFGNSGSYQFRPAASGSNYSIVALTGGGVNSSGTYAYSKNSAYTGRVTYNDSVAGSGLTSQLSFETATTGTVFLQNAAGTAYQTGTLVLSTPSNTAPTITNISSQSTSEDVPKTGILFTVGDAQTPTDSLVVTATSNNTTLVPNVNLIPGGAGASRSLTVTPALNQFGSATITVTVTDGGGLADSENFGFTVTSVNDPPVISSIANQSTAPGTATPVLPFTVSDVESSSLTVTRASTNTLLVPPANIVLGGSGTNRTVTVTPAVGQTGSSTITLTVSDSSLMASTSFTLTVNSPPTISNIPNTVTNEDTATAAIPLTIGDTLTPLSSLTLSATSTNTGLVPVSGIAFGGSGGTRTVMVTPAANQSGTSTIMVTVTDGGGLTASDTFLLTVNAVNDPPVISAIANQTTNVGFSTAAIPFTISDVDSLPASFTITNHVSSNTTLVPVAGIVVGGSGANRTVMVTPAAGQTGVADITLTVGDGQATVSITFRVTVAVPFLIGKGAAWKYLAPLTAASAPAAAWTGIGFSDTTWGSGNAPVGYGGDGEVTAIPIASGKPFTMYLRRKFTVTGAAGTLGLRLNLRRDDGAVVYLNGIEKWRSNMPEGVSISYDTPARGVVFLAHETTWFTREVRATGLMEGENVVAVEVHQYDAASSDLGFDLEVIPLNYTPNAPPWISDIPDRTLAPSADSGAVAFSVGDGESAASALSVTSTASNPAVIPAGSITLGGSGANRTITVTAPAAGQPGSSLITVTVSDGVTKAATAFVVTVTPATSSVKLAAWGRNDEGQLGINSTTDSDNPVAVTFSGSLAAKTPMQVAAGEDHSLVLFSDGTLAAWGNNFRGELGLGDFTRRTIPTAVPMTGALSGKLVSAICAGRFFSMALCTDGTLACWGDGGYGQLGNNGTANSSVPVQVVNTGALGGKRVVAVAAGDYHALSLTSDGVIAAWGYNADGALGDGTTTYSSVPVSVLRTGATNPLLNRTVTAIAAGGDQSLALCSDGTLAAWGDNQDGQLGNNSTADSSVPVQVNSTGVLATRTPVAIAVGNGHCLAACSDGRVVAWGYNGAGQLGDDTYNNRSTPVLVSNTGVLTGKIVSSVIAGVYDSAVICTDGTAAKWGNPGDNVPVVINISGILPGRTIFDMAAGYYFKLVLTAPAPAPFRISTMSRIAAGDMFLGFPTLEGVSYDIEWSDTLASWNRWGTVNGIGGELITRLTGHGAPPQRYFRVSVDQ